MSQRCCKALVRGARMVPQGERITSKFRVPRKLEKAALLSPEHSFVSLGPCSEGTATCSADTLVGTPLPTTPCWLPRGLPEMGWD